MPLAALAAVAAIAALLPAAHGAAPSWWSDRGVINPQGADDDYQAANAGQLKNTATAAYAEMDQQLAQFGGAGPAVTAMAQSLVADDDYAAINQGQLKHVAKPFYDRLIEIGYCDDYPWGSGEQDDWGLMNIGQLKNVFSFDLALDTDADGMPDWWEDANGLDANADDSTGDEDMDGLSNVDEFDIGTDPTDSDTDGDGVPDVWEAAHGHDPNSKDPVIDLGASDVWIDVKQLAAACGYVSTPCWSDISDLQDLWDIVDAAEWPARGSYYELCGNTPAIWDFYPDEPGNPVAWRHQSDPPAEHLELSRILYRYFPVQATVPGTVYRITVLELFEADPGGDDSIHAARTFYLSGDGTVDNYFEPEGGFGDEAGQIIDAPTALGKVSPVVLKVELLVNNTEIEDDDFVVKRKAGGTPPETVNEPRGEDSNEVPMLIRLLGPPGFSTEVSLTVQGGGSVSIKNPDGTEFGMGGETMAVGIAHQVWLSGEIPSSMADDSAIVAAACGLVCGEEDLTVVWIAGEDIQFRGSGHQDEPLTPGSTATFSALIPGIGSYSDDVVGLKIYSPSTGANSDAAQGQMETRYHMSPYVVMPQLEWDIQREVAMSSWFFEQGPQWRPASGTGWYYDNAGDADKDLVQNDSLIDIFQIDAPGNMQLSNTAPLDGWRYVCKAKLREWAEVRIGQKWYVCSPYKYWHVILYCRFDEGLGHWVFDTTRTSAVLPGVGGLTGDPSTWDRD